MSKIEMIQLQQKKYTTYFIKLHKISSFYNKFYLEIFK